MSTSIDLCPTSEEVLQRAPSQFTGRDSGFLAGRRSSTRSLRSFRLAYTDVPRAWWDDTYRTYRASLGGASRVTYTPLRSAVSVACRFSAIPQLATITNGASVSFTVELEEVGV